MDVKGIYYRGYFRSKAKRVIAGYYRVLYEENPLWIRHYTIFLDEINKNRQKYRFELQKIKSVNEKEENI